MNGINNPESDESDSEPDGKRSRIQVLETRDQETQTASFLMWACAISQIVEDQIRTLLNE